MTKRKYILSTGEVTGRPEKYLLDLIKLNLTIYTKDIPWRDDIGFDFLLGEVFKDDFKEAVERKAEELIKFVQNKTSITDVSIELVSVDIVSYSKARICLNVSEIGDTSIDVAIR